MRGATWASKFLRLVVAFLVALILAPAAALSIAACGASEPGTIGAAIGRQGDGRLFLRTVPAGQGAARAGLQPDDEILKIDGRDVRGMTEEDIRKAVRGDLGSVLVLTVARRRDAGAERPGEGRDVLEVRVVRSKLRADEKK